MKEAIKWFQMAAKGGDVEAQCRLGHFYEGADEVWQNGESGKEASLKWYCKVAESGSTDAHERLRAIFFGNNLLQGRSPSVVARGSGGRIHRFVMAS